MRAVTPFGADTALTVGANALLGLEGAVSGVLAARLLGPAGRGELAAIQIFPGLVATVAMLGMIEASVYYCARDSKQAGRHIASAAALALIGSMPLLAVAALAMPYALAAQSPAVIRAARWYLLMAPVYALVALPAHSLRGRGDFVAWNSIRLMPNLLWIMILAGAWCADFRNARVLAIAYVVSQGLLFAPVATMVGRRIPGPFRPAPAEWGGMIRYGLPCTLTNLPQMLNLRLDQIAMAMVLPARELGIYAVAVAWSGTSAPLLNALGATLMPSLAAEHDRAQRAARFARGARLAALIAAASCLILTILTPFAIGLLFGARYQAAVRPAMVLVPAGSILALAAVLEEGMLGLGRPYPVLWAELAGVASTVLVLAATLGRYGVMGGAIASLAGYSTVGAGLLLSAYRLVGDSPSALLLPRAGELRVGLDRVRSLFRALGAVVE